MKGTMTSEARREALHQLHNMEAEMINMVSFDAPTEIRVEPQDSEPQVFAELTQTKEDLDCFIRD